MKPEGGIYQTVTQVKLLSPEIVIIVEAETILAVEGNTLGVEKKKKG